MILAFFALAWLLGIAAAAFAGADLWPTLAAASLLAAASFAYRPRLSTLLLAAAGCALLVTAVWRYDSALPPATPGGIAVYNDSAEPARFRALVVSEPDERPTSVRYRLSTREVLVDGVWQTSEGGVLMWGPLPPRFKYGDLLVVEGKLQTPPTFDDFDYRAYLARQGVSSLILYPSVEVIDHGRGNPVTAALIDVRQRLTRALADALPEPHASLSAAILLGQRTALPQDLTDDLNATGTSHLVAVSGQNVSLVAGLLIAALAWLTGRRRAAWLALAAIVGYALLVGGQPPVQRAAIMGGIYVVGVALGRQNSAPVALVVAGAIMTGLQPLLAKDVSFQLSFAATLGLMTLAPPLRARAEAMMGRWPSPAGFPLTRPTIELTAITVTAIASTLPITAVNFGRISIVAPLANLLAVPAFVAVILTAAVTAVVGLFQPAADLLAWLAWPPVAYMITVVRLLADLPFASLELRGVGVGHAVAYYAALAGGAWLLLRRRPQPVPARPLPQPPATAWLRLLPWQGVALLLALGSALLWLAVTAPAEGRLSVTFLDVGQGDAILVRGPQGHTILVDGSPSGEAVVNALGRHLPFWDDSLDAVVLTHPDADHLTGLLAVLDRYDVQAVLAGPTEADSTQYQTWRRLIAEKGVPYRQARSGDSIDLGRGARILVLHPPPAPLAGTDNDVNNNSLVLRLTMGRTSILLTADLEAEGEFSLLAESTSLRSVALQVPHHGSRSSSTPELLRDVQPLVALISVGADNRFGHPSPEVLARLPARLIYRTDLHGDITVSSDGHKLWIETQRAP